MTGGSSEKMWTPKLFLKMSSVILLYHTTYFWVFDIFDVIKYNLKQLKYYSVTVICSHCAFLRDYQLDIWPTRFVPTRFGQPDLYLKENLSSFITTGTKSFCNTESMRLQYWNTLLVSKNSMIICSYILLTWDNQNRWIDVQKQN